MFKKILIASAGLLLAGQSTFAQYNNAPANGLTPTPARTAPAANVNVTFVGEIDGMPLVIQFTVTGNAIKGTLLIADQRCPLEGSETQPSVIDGVWQAANGTQYRFHAAFRQGKMTFETNGKTVQLAIAANEGPQNDRPQNERPVVRNDGPAPIGGNKFADVTLVTGKKYVVPTPAGWKAREGEDGAMVVSADGRSVYGVVCRVVDEGTKPDQFLDTWLTSMKIRDLKVDSSVKIKADFPCDGVSYVLSFTGPDGIRRSGIFRSMVFKGTNGDMIAVLTHAAAPSDEAEAKVPNMIELALGIRAANANNQRETPTRQQVGLSNH